MIEIPLTSGYTARIDDEDFPKVQARKWFASKYKGRVYAKSSVHNGTPRQLRMHRIILGEIPPGMVIDHIDGDATNNQKHNLRICTQAENTRNRGMSKNNTSGYKGPVWDKVNNMWSVCIRFNYKSIRIGRYADLEEAARAYNRKAIELFGEYASLNDVEDGPIREAGLLDRHNTTGFRGIYKNGNKWTASIQVNRKKIVLGHFLTKEEGARAYDAKAIEIFGESYTKLNFPEQQTQTP